MPKVCIKQYPTDESCRNFGQKRIYMVAVDMQSKIEIDQVDGIVLNYKKYKLK